MAGQAQRYEVLERIAVGGMAEVFRARAVGLLGFEKPVAMKRILPALAQSAGFEARFVSEANLAASLSHANVVQVFDFGRFDGSLCIVMEYVDGMDLRGLLAALQGRGEAASLPVAFHVAIELAKGLEFAHGRGIVHRDISPSNVMLSRAGEVKVADFGIALRGDEAPRAEDAEVVVGKWPYMSPEQTRAEPLGVTSDLFSAGVVLFELFTGQRLFQGSSRQELADAVQTSEIPLASAVRPEVPGGVADLLAGMLQRDPALRPGSAGEVVQALYASAYAAAVAPTPTALAALVTTLAPRAGEPPPVRLDDRIRRMLVGFTGASRATPLSSPRVETTLVRTGTSDNGLTHWRAAPGPARRPLLTWLTAFVVVSLLGVSSAALVRPSPSAPQSTPPVAPAPAPVWARPPEPNRVRVEIRSVPEAAEVRLEGVLRGRTPLVLELPADAAERPLELRRAGYRTALVPLALHPGEAHRVVERKLEALPRFGTIAVFSEPWSDVYLSGKKVGEAPAKKLKLPEGRHRLRLVNPVQKLEAWLDVEVPAREPYRVTLKQAR